MLRPSPNHGTQRLSNDENDDDDDSNVCHATLLSRHDNAGTQSVSFNLSSSRSFE